MIRRDLAWEPLVRGFGVVAVLGALIVALNLRFICDYD
jgi:hypothetical protein